MAFRFIILLAATALCLSGVQADGEVRHNSNTRPLELNVDAMSTYNDKFMALMKSPCRPEYDGFFGATYGDPISIRYGFRIETLPLSNIMDMLDVIEDKVVDSILSSTFPQMCGVHRRQLEQQPERKLGRQLSHASGFRFMKYQEVEKCTPEINKVDFCGIFIGEVNVYGRDQSDAAFEVLSVIDQVLNTNYPQKLHPELTMISTADEYVSVSGSGLSEDGVSTLGWVAIAVAALTVCGGIWFFFLSNQKQGDTGNAFSNNGQRNKRKWNKFFKKHQGDHDFNPEEGSIKPSYEPEAVAFGGGERLLLTNGRPVEIGFNQPYSDAEPTLDPRAREGLI